MVASRRFFLAGLAASVGLFRWTRPVHAEDSTEEMLRRARAAYEEHRQTAIHLNELAGNIQSVADSRKLIDGVAAIFANSLPPMWLTGAIREHIAAIEYDSATDPAKQIPDERIADVWGRYAREIGALEEAIANVAEIRNMRDAFQAGAELFWRRGNISIWTMPNIYALNADGRVAEGGRALETLRVLHGLSGDMDTLRGARERVRTGTLVSDLLRRSEEQKASGRGEATMRIEAKARVNPVDIAESRYVREQGSAKLDLLMAQLFFELFPVDLS